MSASSVCYGERAKATFPYRYGKRRERVFDAMINLGGAERTVVAVHTPSPIAHPALVLRHKR